MDLRRMNGSSTRSPSHVNSSGLPELDYLAAGSYSAIVRDARHEHDLIVVQIPRQFEIAVAEEGGWNWYRPTRLGFRDRRLQNLVASLCLAREVGWGASSLVMLSISIVDRLFEFNQGRLRSSFTPVVKRMIAECLDESIADPDLHRLATLIGLAQTRFSTLFRATFHVSPHRYVSDRRVVLACAGLARGRRFSELASRLGYSSPGHFSTAFRTVTGKSPREFVAANGAKAGMSDKGLPERPMVRPESALQFAVAQSAIEVRTQT